MLLQTSLVANCIITTSGLDDESQPGSWLLLRIPVAWNPPCPSLSPSYAVPQLVLLFSVPTKSTPVYPVLCNWLQSSCRQHPGEPVIESPSGITRTVVAARAVPLDPPIRNAPR